MADKQQVLHNMAAAALDQMPDGEEKDALRKAFEVVQEGGSIADAAGHLADAGEASGLNPLGQLHTSIDALGLVDRLPACDLTSFSYGTLHGICLAVQFPEWAQAFFLKQYPEEEMKAFWHEQHSKIVELTPMRMETAPPDEAEPT